MSVRKSIKEVIFNKVNAELNGNSKDIFLSLYARSHLLPRGAVVGSDIVLSVQKWTDYLQCLNKFKTFFLNLDDALNESGDSNIREITHFLQEIKDDLQKSSPTDTAEFIVGQLVTFAEKIIEEDSIINIDPSENNMDEDVSDEDVVTEGLNHLSDRPSMDLTEDIMDLFPVTIDEVQQIIDSPGLKKFINVAMTLSPDSLKQKTEENLDQIKKFEYFRKKIITEKYLAFIESNPDVKKIESEKQSLNPTSEQPFQVISGSSSPQKHDTYKKLPKISRVTSPQKIEGWYFTRQSPGESPAPKSSVGYQSPVKKFTQAQRAQYNSNLVQSIKRNKKIIGSFKGTDKPQSGDGYGSPERDDGEILKKPVRKILVFPSHENSNVKKTRREARKAFFKSLKEIEQENLILKSPSKTMPKKKITDAPVSPFKINT